MSSYVFPVPIYRFFDKKEYAELMVNDGIVRFTNTSAFASDVVEEKFRDEGEKLYKIKTIEKPKLPKELEGMDLGGGITHQWRPIDDAWAFCGTTSIVSSARKNYCVYLKSLGSFLNKLDQAVQKQFGERLIIMSSPIAYYRENLDVFNIAIHAPYFTKHEDFKRELEFRIVIIPSESIYSKGQITSIDLNIENPQEEFELTNVFET